MHKHILDDLGARVRDRRAQDSPVAGEPSPSLEPGGEPFVGELMAPLPPERARAILDRVLELPAASADGATVLPFAPSRPARSRRWVLPLSLTMAAVAMVLVVTRIDRTEHLITHALLDADAYELTLLDAPAVARGADGAPPSYTAGDPVVVRLRPREPVHGRVEAVVRAIQGPRELDLLWRASASGDQGHLEIAGAADDLLTAASGVWELEVTLRRDETSAPLWRGRTRLLVAPDRHGSP